MRSRSSRLVMYAAILASAVLVFGATMAYATAFSERRITDEAVYQESPDSWGGTIVWQEDREGDGLWEIWMYNMVTASEERISDPASDAFEPEIYGDKVVWVDYRDYADGQIYLYDLSDGTETPITGATDSIWGEPDIHGDHVVWAQDHAGHAKIHVLDLTTGIEDQLHTDGFDHYSPSIWGEYVVWTDNRMGNTDIYLYDVVTEQETRLTVNDADQKSPAICGERVVYLDRRDNGSYDNIYLMDLSTGEETSVTADAWGHVYPQIHGDKVVWHDDHDGNDNIFMYDVSDGGKDRVTGETAEQSWGSIWGNTLVWRDYRNHKEAFCDVYAASFPVDARRAAGLDRYSTAASISRSHYASSEFAIVATGEDFPDALSASGLAGAYQAPLVLTSSGALSGAARDELNRLGAKRVIIVGGAGAVSDEVATALDGAGYAVDRIGGSDRYDTAAKVAERIKTVLGPAFGDTTFVARGDGFADALAVSAAAYYNRMPILLVAPTSLPSATRAAIETLPVKNAVIAGGTSAVSESTEDALDYLLTANGGGVEARWAGADRYETAKLVAQNSVDRRWCGTGFVGLAVGDNFPDALAGGVAAGREYGVLLLTPGSSLSTQASEFLGYNRDGVCVMEGFGGDSVLSDSVLAQAEKLVN